MNNTKTVDEYIKSCPEEVQTNLHKIRKLIQEEAPDAEESISYGLAGYKLNKKPLIYFGGYKTHIGIYPTSSEIEKEVKEAEKYRSGKGTLQFPLTEPFPLDLLKKIIRTRIKQVSA